MLDYRRDIDGLRALAVMAVVLYHADFGLVPAGYLGVDIFFVISGYLITSLILKDQKAGVFTLRNFWERRIRRILPALLAVIICVVCVGQLILLAPDYKMLGQQVMSQSIFSSNILFASQVGYFDPQGEYKPLLHTWSLAVEEQFYLVFPVVLLLAFRHIPKRVPVLLIGLFVLSYGLCIYGSLYYPFESFYLLPGRAWELLLGALVCFVPAVKLGRVESEGLAALSLGMIVTALLSFEAYTTNPWNTMIVPCVGAAVLLWLGIEHRTAVVRLLSWQVLTGIGLISYSLYLWHWPVFVYATYMQDEPPLVSVRIGLIALSIALAILSWRHIETPFRRKTVLASSSALFRAAVVSVVLMFGLGGALYLSHGLPGRFPDEVNRYANAVYDSNPRQAECHNLTPTMLLADGPCKLGVRDQPPAFLAFGDSEAEALMPVLDKLATEAGTTGLFASYNSCPPIFDIGRPDHQKSFDCRGFNDAVRATIKETGVRRVVLMGRWSAYTDMYLLSDDQHTVPGSFDENREIFELRLSATIRELQTQGVDVWLVMQPPEYKFDVPRRLANSVRLGQDVTQIGQPATEYAKKQAVLAPILQQFPDVHVVKFEALCPDQKFCVTERFGQSLYKDSHHLSGFGAEIMAPSFSYFFSGLQK